MSTLIRRYRGRHRHVRRSRAPYAAAGLLALTGTVAPHHPRPVTRPATPVRRVTSRRTVLVVRASRGAARTPVVLRGRASWYGPGFAGHRTASGEVFDPSVDLTAAHRWLPFGTRLRVCYRERCVVVRVNDRGPFGHAILDLSYAAALRLGMVRAGIVPVTATVVSGA